MTQNTTTPARLGRGEFIALIAMLFATIAVSIDAMLPAMPLIEAQLTPADPNRAQLIVAAFIFGMGFGTLVTGPLSDAFGRKPVIMGGAAIYCAASVACYFSGNLEMLLIARFAQGLGASAPRTVSLAMVRDLFKGREMAQVMSYAMMIFTLVPAIAPMIGQAVISVADWHDIFLLYVVFSLISIIWLGFRQPETIHSEDRKPLSFTALKAAAVEMSRHRIAWVSILIQSLTTGSLFAVIISVQGVFDQHFDRGESFPYWFGGIAILSGMASLINAKVVVAVGMRRVITVTFAVVLTVSLIHLVLRLFVGLSGTTDFVVYLIWQVCVFGMMGLTMGNLTALAMEPLGHIAGFASSIIASVATVLSVLLAVPVGQAFDGTPLPLVIGVTIFVGISLFLTRFFKT